MRLIIVRHGVTEENTRGVLQGQKEGTLTEHGKHQSKNLAYSLKNEKIDMIFSSDLKRTMHMAKEIAKYHNLKIHKTMLLRERRFGIFEGRKREKLVEARKASGQSIITYTPPHGESFLEVKKRVERFLKTLYKRYPNKNILLVTHGVVIRAICWIYLGMTPKEAESLKTINAGILILSITKSRNRKLREAIFVRD
jgi:broad specificity phosphatase PhoE